MAFWNISFSTKGLRKQKGEMHGMRSGFPLCALLLVFQYQHYSELKVRYKQYIIQILRNHSENHKV